MGWEVEDMIIGVAFYEGSWPLAIDINPLDLPTIIATGELHCPNYYSSFGVITYSNTPNHKLTALFLGNNIIYDFILRDSGLPAIRYRPGYMDGSCTWAD